MADIIWRCRRWVDAYQIKGMKKGLPVWEKIDGAFADIRVAGFSVPTIVRDDKTVYLFVGQQDGRIRTFKAEIADNTTVNYRSLRFVETGTPCKCAYE